MPPVTNCVSNRPLLFRPIHLLLCLPVLAACGSTPTAGSFRPAAVETGHASVYIYRPPAMKNVMYAPELHIDDSFRLQVGSGRKVHFSLPAKTTRFEVISDYSTIGSSRLELELADGQTRYLRIDSTLELSDGPGYAPYRRGFSLREVPADTAREEIAGCCSDSAAPAPVGNRSTGDTGENAGFSSDKTHNPFSH